MSDDILRQLVIPDARGNRNRMAVPIDFQVLRELGEGDIERLLDPEALPRAAQRLKDLRQSHHHLAQVLAQGISQEQASLVTGYSPSRISVLKGDPAFAELLEYYQSNQESKFAEVTERKVRLGLSMLDELQERLEEGPEKFTNRELLDGAEQLLKADGRGGAAMPGGPAVNLSVSFVNPGDGSGVVIEGGLE